jgi:hypothetical protein
MRNDLPAKFYDGDIGEACVGVKTGDKFLSGKIMPIG